MSSALSSSKSSVSSHFTSLETILRATTHHRTYCQGLNFLAANFLMNDETPRNAFILLNYLLRQSYLEILFDSKCSSLMEYMKVFEKRLRLHNKTVYNHFKNNNFGTFCYAIEWFTTCFIVSNPGPLSACCIDLLLMGYNNILLRVGLAITDVIGKDVLLLNQEELQIEFKKLTRSVDAVSTLTRALTLKQTGKKDDVLKLMSLNIYFMNPRHELTDTMFDPTLKYDEEIVTLTMIGASNNAVDQVNKRDNRGGAREKLARKVMEKALTKDMFFRRRFNRENRRDQRLPAFDASTGLHLSSSSTPVDAAAAQLVVRRSRRLGQPAAPASHEAAINSGSDENLDVSIACDTCVVYNRLLSAPATSSRNPSAQYLWIRDIFREMFQPGGYDGDDERCQVEDRGEDEDDARPAVGAIYHRPGTGKGSIIINRQRSNSYLASKYRSKSKRKKRKGSKEENGNSAGKEAHATCNGAASTTGVVISVGSSRVSCFFEYQGGLVDCKGVFESSPPVLGYMAWRGDATAANDSNKYDISRY